MARFPSPYDQSGPARLRVPDPVTPVSDTTGRDIAGGVAGFAQGLNEAGENLGQIAMRQQEQEIAIDLSRAEAYKTAQFLDIQKSVNADMDYGTYEERYTPMIGDAVNKAAGLIRNDRARERWAASQEEAKVRMNGSVTSHGIQLRDDANRTALEISLGDNMKLLSDPTLPREVRDKIEKDMQGSIIAGQATGLITPSQSALLTEKYIKGGRNALAVNNAELDILIDPNQVMVGMAIPTVGSGSSVINAMSAVDGGPVPLEFSLAKMTAELIGDANFPDDPALAEAYLSDPEKAEDYAVAAQAMLSDRYKGDLTAAVIAMDPNGGTALADEWVRSKHDESKLPPAVRDRYREVMASLTVEQPFARIPLVAGEGVDFTTTDSAVLAQFENLQSRFGMALPIISAARDPKHNAEVGGADKSEHLNKRALDIDVSALSEEQRVKLIEMASAMGFTGIGVYKNSLHLDTGALRAWGPDHHRESVPGWAEETIAAHTSGKVNGVPTLYAGVAPEYADLTFDQRMTLYNKAKSAADDRDIAGRAALMTIGENAPVAIATTGTYDGELPTAREFVTAWGAEEGIARFKQFEASIDVARTTYGMKTMSTAEIQSAMQDAVPMSSGNDAALEQKRFEAITQAGNAILKARDSDPAGYTIGAFPNVRAAWEAANDGKIPMSRFMSMAAEAQRKLGIEEPAYLPQAAAAQAAATFKDTTLGAEARVAAVTGLVLSTTDLSQQNAVFTQLVKEGLPSMLSPALDALRRGDNAAAQSLLRAVLFDPDDIKLALPAGQKSADIKAELLSDVFSPGQIGDIVYGLTGGGADNLQQTSDAIDVMTRVVKQRLVDGTAGGDLNRAIELAKKDMFGDTQTITGKSGGLQVGIGPFSMGSYNAAGVKVAVPKDVQPDLLRAGFNTLMPQVRSTLRDMAMGGGLGSGNVAADTTFAWSIDNYVDAAMAEGYFTNASGMVAPGETGFVFFDPNSDSAVTDADGNVLVFSLDEVLAAGLNGG